ncbi:MAG: hypothetical protein JEY99_05880 [Spirochaetales bacterium]|nr:hypothetical protein [Spirochaetales bacterium]
MKYQIDTIPVLKAYEKAVECPICNLKEKAEEAGIRYYLGHSVMVPEIRIKLNETGFCKSHFTALLNAEDSRLGLALMTHTRMLKVCQDMKKELSPGSLGGGYFDKKTKKLIEKIEKTEKSCPLCIEISQTLLRYSATIAWLWDNEPDFPEVLLNSKGFCHTHLPLIFATGADMLTRKKYTEYYQQIYNLQTREMNRMAEEIEWNTKKFDTTNKDASWGTSRDALPRAIGKLIGS